MSPTLKLAILGADPDLVTLLAAARDEGHESVWLGELSLDEMRAIQHLVPRGLSPSQNWETVLDHATADAVLVGRSAANEDLRAEQLRRLAAEAVPMLIVHPAVQSVLAYYEIDMLRRETGGIVRHYNPLVADPLVAETAGWVREGHPTIGQVHQVACTRRATSLAREAVLAGLARDVELLAAVAGDIRHVSAIGPREAGGSYASLQVHLSSSSAASLHWSVVPYASDAPEVEMTLVGEFGAIKCQQIGDRGFLIADSPDQSEIRNPKSEITPPPVVAIRTLAAAVNEKSSQRRAEMSTWDRATRAMEVVDAVELSLQKGRTIEVHQQQLTEQLAFRGTMAAVGCGLLLVGFLVAIVVGFVGGVEKLLGQRVAGAWPAALLAVLAVFLLLQALPVLATRRKPGARSQLGRGVESNSSSIDEG